MGLKWLLYGSKLTNLRRIPTILPENRQNRQKWKEFALITPAQHSRAALNLLNDFLMRTCVPINARRFFACKVTSFMK